MLYILARRVNPYCKDLVKHTWLLVLYQLLLLHKVAKNLLSLNQLQLHLVLFSCVYILVYFKRYAPHIYIYLCAV